MSTTSVVILLSTVPPGAADRLARALVEESLAACVNRISGIRSTYRWEGELCDDEETLLVIKTTREVRERCQERLVELHPYSVPEVLTLPVESGHPAYLDWVLAGVAPGASEPPPASAES